MSTLPVTDVEPSTEAPDCWPPLAHLIEKDQFPVKPGTVALCGARLMGIDLRNTDCKVCARCVEIARRSL